MWVGRKGRARRRLGKAEGGAVGVVVLGVVVEVVTDVVSPQEREAIPAGAAAISSRKSPPKSTPRLASHNHYTFLTTQNLSLSKFP